MGLETSKTYYIGTPVEIGTPVWVTHTNFKFNFYFSEFHVSVTSEDGKEAYMCTGPEDQSSRRTHVQVSQAALSYWNTTSTMKETIIIGKNNNDDRGYVNLE